MRTVCVLPGEYSGEPGHLDRHLYRGRHATRVCALDRRNVRVVPPDGDPDVPGPDLDVVGRVEAPPAAGPRLDPRVALAGHRLADARVRLGVQVAGHVPAGDADRPQHQEREVRVV